MTNQIKVETPFHVYRKHLNELKEEVKALVSEIQAIKKDPELKKSNTRSTKLFMARQKFNIVFITYLMLKSGILGYWDYVSKFEPKRRKDRYHVDEWYVSRLHALRLVNILKDLEQFRDKPEFTEELVRLKERYNVTI